MIPCPPVLLSRYLRIERDGGTHMELGEDYLQRVTFWEDIMIKYNFTFNLSNVD